VARRTSWSPANRAVNEYDGIEYAALPVKVDGEPLIFSPHAFRGRIFATDAIMSRLPPHLALIRS
jgi:hypothetical protein